MYIKSETCGGEQVRDLPLAMSNMFKLLVDGGEALVVFLASNPIFRYVLALSPAL
jgi:hypothetical protein